MSKKKSVLLALSVCLVGYFVVAAWADDREIDELREKAARLLLEAKEHSESGHAQEAIELMKHSNELRKRADELLARHAPGEHAERARHHEQEEHDGDAKRQHMIEQIKHLHEAGEHLHLAGMQEQAQELRREAENRERELERHHGGEGGEDVARHVEEMGKHLHGLHRHTEGLTDRVKELTERLERVERVVKELSERRDD